jgi:S-adenosylmethionine hydrolase
MLIAILTDFGTRDPYVAAMKGVIVARTDAPILDLTHDIAPFDILEAAWFLRTIEPYWSDTIFVCVVDPGVGTARKIVCARKGSNVYLAPDNGLLTFIAGEGAAVDDESLFLPGGSTTFHGRDRFAPVAAAIANGLAIHGTMPLGRLPYEEPSYGDPIRGTIVHIDRFGNAITDVRATAGVAKNNGVTISRWSSTYSGEGPFLIAGSSGTVEISMANASAAECLQLRRLDRIELCAAF